jgi:hypothetical protein
MVLVDNQNTFRPIGWKLVGKRYDLIILYHDECSKYLDEMGSEKYKFCIKTLLGHAKRVEIRLGSSPV